MYLLKTASLYCLIPSIKNKFEIIKIAMDDLSPLRNTIKNDNMNIKLRILLRISTLNFFQNI